MAEEKINFDLFEDLDYNSQLDVYWDALEVTEESALNILPPNSENIGFASPEKQNPYR